MDTVAIRKRVGQRSSDEATAETSGGSGSGSSAPARRDHGYESTVGGGDEPKPRRHVPTAEPKLSCLSASVERLGAQPPAPEEAREAGA